MTQDEINEVLRLHKLWLSHKKGGKCANLRGADLRGANLQGADLRNANFDYSCFPLWCGGTRFNADKKLVQQVLAHLCSLIIDDETKFELDKIRDFAKQSHRAKDCGILED